MIFTIMTCKKLSMQNLTFQYLNLIVHQKSKLLVPFLSKHETIVHFSNQVIVSIGHFCILLPYWTLDRHQMYKLHRWYGLSSKILFDLNINIKFCEQKNI